MSSTSIPRGQSSTSFSKSDFKPLSVGRSSFRVHDYPNNTQVSSIGSSPRSRPTPRYSFNTVSSLHDGSLRESPYSEQTHSERATGQRKRRFPTVPKSSGPIYSTQARKELASIDRINDSASNSLVCAGKSHLGLYKFNPDKKSIKCVHDFMAVGNGQSNSLSPNFKKRNKQIKLSTIADVKTGFHNHKNYVAVCSSSTAISVFDMNRTGSSESSFVTALSEHTRSINSFDFNTVQTNLIISGGQDSCIKVWDLRSSNAKNSKNCDLSINTASDSIRDVKWMPFQNYAFNHQQEFKNGSNAGFKFASIHYSGLLLNFDLRQPGQIEKRINAHSGPGLCLSWHPNLEYIATGGRDGKCGLWYVGDRQQYENACGTPSSNLYGHSAHANLAALPETTLSTGLPVTKLKFRPAYEKNVFNSLLALSPMTDDAALNIYSLARKYIPKHVLLKSTQTLGLVWWDEELIFDIDKENNINGWDIAHEPTILDNLPKTVTRWRDIEGNGLLFVDQNCGSYDLNQNQLIMPEDSKKVANHRISMSSLSANNGGSTTGLINNLKKGISHSTLSSYNGDRPPYQKSGVSFNAKSPSAGMSHNTSNVSTPYISQTESKDTTPPTMVTLDLPYILSSMRISRLSPERNMARSPEVVAIRESPVKVFKFLARELEFSGNHEKREGSAKSVYQQGSVKDEDFKEDLMQRFGLLENTTWAALVNKKSEQDIKLSRELTNNDISNDQEEKPQRRESSSEEGDSGVHSKRRSALTESIEVANSVQQKVDRLLELIPICGHNASVYSYIDELPNFKVWLLIRDSLLWDLKKISLDELQTQQHDYEDHSAMADDISAAAMEINESVNPGCSSGVTSGVNSFVDEAPQALNSESIDGMKKHLEAAGKSKLKQQIMAGKMEISTEKNPTLASSSKSTHKLDEPPFQQRQTANEAEAVSIEDDSDRDTLDVPNTVGGLETIGIPILQKRKQRPSFIDTFMTDVRSPHDVNTENEFLERSRRSHSFTHSSPNSKLSSMQSFGNGVSPSAALKKFAYQADSIMSLSPKKQPNHLPSSFEQLMGVRTSKVGSKKTPSTRSKDTPPPWNTKRLLKQLYQQAVEMGNILLAVNILLLFQNIYHLTSTEVVKNSLAQFTTILHQYELFEISAAILKYCPWDDIFDTEGSQSLITLFCDKCGKLITNEPSKEKFAKEAQIVGDTTPLARFGHWYCDSCKKPNSLCVMCEQPMKNLTMTLLECGHEGHFECLKGWFLDDNLTECPAGCSYKVIT